MAKKRPPFHVGDRVTIAAHTPLIPAYGGKPAIGRGFVLRVSSVTGKGTLRDPWSVHVTDGTNLWYMQPDDLVKAEGAADLPITRVVTTNLHGLLRALGMTLADLHRDRRYSKATGDETIVLETRGGGNQLHIIEAPPWLTAQDFGPIGVSWAKRAGWG